MLPEARDKRMSYDLTMPSPPKPKRRGPLEFYEWIVLMLFLISFGVSIAVHVELEADSSTTPSIREENNILTYPDMVAAFFFLLLVVFDSHAYRRYSMYSDELLTQWKDDKIRFMKIYSEEMERRAKVGNKSNSTKKK